MRELTAITETAYLLGIAVGRRLGPQALKLTEVRDDAAFAWSAEVCGGSGPRTSRVLAFPVTPSPSEPLGDKLRWLAIHHPETFRAIEGIVDYLVTTMHEAEERPTGGAR